MTNLQKYVMSVGLIVFHLCICVDCKDKLCADKGCLYDGNIKEGDGGPSENGAKCSCVAACVGSDTCCEDYYEVCASQITTTIVITTTNEGAQTTTIAETITTEGAQTTATTETTTTGGAQTTAPTETTTTEDAQTTATTETTTTGGAQTTATTETITTKDAQTTATTETTTTEDAQTTATTETTTTKGEQTTAPVETTSTQESNETTNCGPFPSWHDIEVRTIDGNTVHYVCSEGFSFSDNKESKASTCNQQGEWEPVFEQCQETEDPTAEAVYWKPTEAPGAYYIGSSALILVVAEIIFMVLFDLSNCRKSFRFCIKSIRDGRCNGRRNSLDSEASDIDESPHSNTSPPMDLSPVFLASSFNPPTPPLNERDIELTDFDHPAPVANENMVAW